jgi:hypothetical protein
MFLYLYPPTAVSVSIPPGSATEATQILILDQLTDGVVAAYLEDGIVTPANIDTALPANNRGLPSALYIDVDGFQTAIKKDNVVPANTIPMPIEVIGGSGTAIDFATEATLQDVLTEITDLNSKAFASKVSTGNSTVTPLGVGGTFTGTTEDVLHYSAITTTIVTDRPGTLITEYSNDGLSWDYSESFIITVAAPGTPESFTFSVLAECRFFRIVYTNGAAPQGVFKMQTVLKANAVSGEIHQVGFALNARTEAQVTKGVIYGLTTGGGGGYVAVKVNPSGALSVAVTPGPLTPSYQEIVNLTTVPQTFVAPANAIWAKVYAFDTNLFGIRVKMGGVSSTSSGIQFQAGRSEDFQAVGNISVCAEGGTNQKICVQFGV